MNNKMTKILIMSVFFIACFVISTAVCYASYTTLPDYFDLSGAKTAEITLGATAVGTNMELIGADVTDSTLSTYSAVTEIGGKTCREVTSSNKLSFRFDDSFASEEDEVFLFEFDYWDYDGGGLFWLDVACFDEGGTNVTRHEVYKRGTGKGSNRVQGAWRTEYYLVTGACFTHNLENGADFWIANRANNAFTRIKVYNLSDRTKMFEPAVFDIRNTDMATKLFNLGILKGDAVADVTGSLGNKLTRLEAVELMIAGLGRNGEAAAYTGTCRFSDAPEDKKSLIAYADSIGIIDKTLSSFKGDEIITKKELISYYLNFLKIDYTDETMLAAARENGLITANDYMSYINTEAIRDNMMGMMFRILKTKPAGSERILALELFEKEIITIDGMISSGETEFINELFKEPVYREPIKKVDETTGRTYYYLDFFGTSIMRPYMTQQSWAEDNESFVFCDPAGNIYLYNTRTYYIRKLAETNNDFTSFNMAPKSNHLYYVSRDNQIRKINLDTYEETLVVQLPPNANPKKTGFSDIGISNDESIISFHINVQDDNPNFRREGWYDAVNDELHLEFGVDMSVVDAPGYYSQHTAVNPVYTNLIYFASGGLYTGPEPRRSYTRSWILDRNTMEWGMLLDEYKVGYFEGRLNYGEQNCHESWTCDGEWMVLNKAQHGSGRGQFGHVGIAGLLFLSKDGRDRRYIGQGDLTIEGITYHGNYTHPGTHPIDPRWVVADADTSRPYNKGKNVLFLIDAESGKTWMLVNTACKEQSEYHMHPGFSKDGKKAIWGIDFTEDPIGRICWMDISDLIDNPPEGSRVTVSDSIDALDFKDFEYDLNLETKNGETVYRIKDGKKMYFDVNNDVVWGRVEDVTLEITYLDSGIGNVILEYITWDDSRLTRYLEEHKYEFSKTNTGKWKTKTITLEDVNLDNMALLGTDMKIYGSGADLVIKNITARK